MSDAEATPVTPEKLSVAVPVADMDAAVAAWTTLLGVGPTFVDGDRWAQFDTAGGRVALAGADRVTDATAVMIKVADADAARTSLEAAGLTVGPVEAGAHERRFVVAAGAAGAPVVLYSPA